MALIEHEVPEHDLIHLLELRKENLEIVEVQIDKSYAVSRQARLRAEAARRSRLISVMREARRRSWIPTPSCGPETRSWRSSSRVKTSSAAFC